MKALTLDEVLPLEEYAGRRSELLQQHGEYLDRCRRVHLGPQVTLIFENRETLWFRLHEILRVARVSEQALVQQELSVYNRLLPTPGCLQAALLIAIRDERYLTRELAPWQDLRGEHLCLYLGEHRYPANLYTCRPEDRCIGAAHWVQFALDENGKLLLGDPRVPAFLRASLPTYQHDSEPLSDEVRASLLEDLNLG